MARILCPGHRYDQFCFYACSFDEMHPLKPQASADRLISEQPYSFMILFS